MPILGHKELELLERFILALERIAESYETSVCNQAKMIDKTTAMVEATTAQLDPTKIL